MKLHRPLRIMILTVLFGIGVVGMLSSCKKNKAASNMTNTQTPTITAGPPTVGPPQ